MQKTQETTQTDFFINKFSAGDCGVVFGRHTKKNGAQPFHDSIEEEKYRKRNRFVQSSKYGMGDGSVTYERARVEKKSP